MNSNSQQNQLNNSGISSVLSIHSPLPKKILDNNSFIKSYHLIAVIQTQDRIHISQSNELKNSIESLRRQSANPIDKDEKFEREINSEEFDSEIEEFSVQLEEI